MQCFLSGPTINNGTEQSFKFNEMTEAMMPISTDALHYRTLLFELNEPVIMSIDKFDEVRIMYFLYGDTAN